MKEHNRLASLDFLRGAAAFLVAIPHFFIFEKIGVELFESISILGVEIFFVLSGYVLAPQLLFFIETADSMGHLRTFLVRRWMRTIPAYAIALTVMSLLLHHLGSPDFFGYLVYCQNLWGQLNGDDYFSIAWSLSVEEWFYIVFPVVLILFFRLTGRKDLKTAVIAAIGFIAFISALRIFVGGYQDWGPSVRRVVAFRIDSIAYGFLLYIGLNKTSFHIAKIAPILIGVGFVTVTVLGIMLAVNIGHDQSISLETLFPFYAALFGAMCIMAALRAHAFFAAHPRLAELGLFLGRISYSVYLFHLIILTALAQKLSGLPIGFRFIAIIGMTILVAYLMYTAIEAPILAARPKFKRAVSDVGGGN